MLISGLNFEYIMEKEEEENIIGFRLFIIRPVVQWLSQLLLFFIEGLPAITNHFLSSSIVVISF